MSLHARSKLKITKKKQQTKTDKLFWKMPFAGGSFSAARSDDGVRPKQLSFRNVGSWPNGDLDFFDFAPKMRDKLRNIPMLFIASLIFYTLLQHQSLVFWQSYPVSKQRLTLPQSPGRWIRSINPQGDIGSDIMCMHDIKRQNLSSKISKLL